MSVLVTGAGGFLGRSVVQAAACAGHGVVALVRPASEGADPIGAGVDVVRGDLRQPSWLEHLDVNVVVHLASSTEGGLAEQFAGTVTATERLLSALDLSRLDRFVHVSSFSVYDFAGVRAGGCIAAASTPLEPRPEHRDAYTTTKLAQERLVRRACADHDVDLVVLRPGVIFGPGRTWAWGSGLSVGGVDLIVAPRSTFRLTYVDNCAEAVVRAIDAPHAGGGTFDIVDDDLPTHAGFHRSARRAGARCGRAVPVPWWLVRLVGTSLDHVDRRLLGGRIRVPELLAARRQQARWKPFRYDNNAARQGLAWTPRLGIQQAIEATVQAERHRETVR